MQHVRSSIDYTTTTTVARNTTQNIATFSGSNVSFQNQQQQPRVVVPPVEELMIPVYGNYSQTPTEQELNRMLLEYNVPNYYTDWPWLNTSDTKN